MCSAFNFPVNFFNNILQVKVEQLEFEPFARPSLQIGKAFAVNVLVSGLTFVVGLAFQLARMPDILSLRLLLLPLNLRLLNLNKGIKVVELLLKKYYRLQPESA
jgi:hypothetical protein